MSHPTLVALSSPSVLRPALAHEIRNAMAVARLHHIKDRGEAFTMALMVRQSIIISSIKEE